MGQSIFLTEDPASIPEQIPPDILFRDFFEIYFSDMQGRLKATTLAAKRWSAQSKLLPVFGDCPMNAITPAMIRNWQTEILRQDYSDTYLKTLDMNLFSIFKYADRYYDIPNPYARADHMGSSSSHRMQFWTLDEYKRFIRVFDDAPVVKTAFEALYWTGMRVGELLALTPEDIDHEAVALRITKTYTRHRGHDLVTAPKTPNSVRTVALPDFLYRELCDHITACGIKKNERLFPHTTDYLDYHLKKGCRLSGVKRIRIHDIRHSHVSLLINNGFTAVAIASRVGHKHISTTMNVYSHLFPNRQSMLVDALQDIHDSRETGGQTRGGNTSLCPEG